MTMTRRRIPSVVRRLLWGAAAAVLITAAWRIDAMRSRASGPAAGNAAVVTAGADGSAMPAEGGPTVAPEVPLYEREYPAVGYTRVPPSGAVARLIERLAQGHVALEMNPPRGLLDSLLAALDIDPASQTLVFSATSQQTSAIRPSRPRAIYFNDDVYVAWVQGGGPLEIASLDPLLGPVFHTLEHREGAPLQRRTAACLRCHDSQSMQGGGVPRFLLGSGYIGTLGQIVTHEGWIVTSQRTPMRHRFGGWYVTGRHGGQVHLGNIVVHDVAALGDLEALRRGNLTTLEALVDTGAYAAPGSDIVALLVLQHQIDVQNRIAQVGFELRQALANGPVPRSQVEALVEPLVEAMTFVGVPAFSEPIEGSAAFIEAFTRRGPQDREGRSLRDLDLETRLMRYPLSYLIHSEGFEALPEAARTAVYRRVAGVLGAETRDPKFAHITPEDDVAIRAILLDTHDEFGALLARGGAASAGATP